MNHYVNVWSAHSVATMVNGGNLHHTICVRVPATQESHCIMACETWGGIQGHMELNSATHLDIHA